MAALTLVLSFAAFCRAEDETLNIGSFEEPDTLDRWQFSNAAEGVAGLKGHLTWDGERVPVGSKGALKLDGAFPKGGAVAMTRPLSTTFKEFRVTLYAPGYKAITFRAQDAEKQWFEADVPLKDQPDWQTVSVASFDKCIKPASTPEGGKWRGNIRELWIVNAQKNLTAEAKEGILWVDRVELVREKYVLPVPKPITEGVRAPEYTLFGFSAHMIHNDLFYGPERMAPYWQPKYTLPFVVEGGFGCMREPLYQAFFANETKPNPNRDKHRARVEEYLQMYSKAGVKVLLCPMFTTVQHAGFDEYFEWLATLPAKHPCIQGFELHNEPNLKHFWPHGAAKYAEACKAGGKILREKAPGTPIVIGSISHLWWGPGVKFLKDVLAAGTLDIADGISAHPYRVGSAPEGGHMHAEKTDPQGLEKELVDFWAMVQQYNRAGKPLGLYLTEFGYSTGKGKGELAPEQAEGIGSLEKQADYLSRYMMVFFESRLRGVPIEGVYWYDLKCDAKDKDHMEGNFGLVSYDLSGAKPAFEAYSRLAKFFQNPHEWEACDLQTSFGDKDAAVKRFVWRRLSDGALAVVFWRLDQLPESGDKDFDAALALTLPDGFAPAAEGTCDGQRDLPRVKLDASAAGKISATLKVNPRAAWLIVPPATPSKVKPSKLWQHTLPAKFALADGLQGTITVNGPLKTDQKQVEFVFDIEITGDKDAQGALSFMGKREPLELKAGAKLQKKCVLNGGDVAFQLARYCVELNGVVAARGDFGVAGPTKK